MAVGSLSWHRTRVPAQGQIRRLPPGPVGEFEPHGAGIDPQTMVLRGELPGRWQQAARAVIVLLSLHGYQRPRPRVLLECHPATVPCWVGHGPCPCVWKPARGTIDQAMAKWGERDAIYRAVG
jgi:hypothetical protein